MNLRVLSQEDIIENKDNQLSLYQSGKVSSKVLADCIVDIKKAFPKLLIGWYDVLEEMLDEEKFSDKRLIDATKNLIKNCVYPEPTIANIISFDWTVKVYTYDELMEKHKDAYHMGSTSDPIYTNYERIDFYGQERWAKKEDVLRFNLTKWIIKKGGL
jgi:hypothetical protein